MDTKKLLLIQALSKNQSTFAHSAFTAKELTDGNMKISFDNITKTVCFRYGANVVKIDLKNLVMTGLRELGRINLEDLEHVVKTYGDFVDHSFEQFDQLMETVKNQTIDLRVIQELLNLTRQE